jgi:hypothetical protein
LITKLPSRKTLGSFIGVILRATIVFVSLFLASATIPRVAKAQNPLARKRLAMRE